jgi:hypothetical protein
MSVSQVALAGCRVEVLLLASSCSYLDDLPRYLAGPNPRHTLSFGELGTTASHATCWHCSRRQRLASPETRHTG